MSQYNIDNVLQALDMVISPSDNTSGGALSVVFQKSVYGKLEKSIYNNVKKAILECYIPVYKEQGKELDNIKKALEENTSVQEETNDTLNNINNTSERQVNATNTSTRTLTNAIERSAEEYANNVSNSLRNGIVPAFQKMFKGDFLGAFGSITSMFPKLDLVLSMITPVVSYALDVNKRNLETFDKLNNTGIILTETYTQLYDYASEVGITRDALVEGMTKYSKQLSTMGGYFKDSVNAFTKLTKATKETADKIGMDLPVAEEAAMKVYDDLAFSYKLQNKSMSDIVTESQKYIKTLQNLSKLTGQSAQTIMEEIKAREKDNLWKVLQSDPKNQQKILAMQSLGWSQDIQEAVLTGVPNEAYSMMMQNPIFKKQLEGILNAKDGASATEMIENGYSKIDESTYNQMASQWKFLQNNPNLIAALRNTPYGDSLTYGANAGLNYEEWKKENKDNIKALETQANIKKEMDVMKNSVEKAFSLEPANINTPLGALKGIYWLLIGFFGVFTVKSMIEGIAGILTGLFGGRNAGTGAGALALGSLSQLLLGAASAISIGQSAGVMHDFSKYGVSGSASRYRIDQEENGFSLNPSKWATMFMDWLFTSKQERINQDLITKKEIEQEQRKQWDIPFDVFFVKYMPLIQVTHQLLNSMDDSLSTIDDHTTKIWRIMYDNDLREKNSLWRKISDVFVNKEAIKETKINDAVNDLLRMPRKNMIDKKIYQTLEETDEYKEKYKDFKPLNEENRFTWWDKMTKPLWKSKRDDGIAKRADIQERLGLSSLDEKIKLNNLWKEKGESGVNKMSDDEILSYVGHINNTPIIPRERMLSNMLNENQNQSNEKLDKINNGISKLNDSFNKMVNVVKEGNQIKKNSNFNNEIYAMS